MCLNYKKYKCSLSDDGDVSMHRMAVCDKILTASELMASTLVQYITIASNNCGYVGTLELLIINYVHPQFLKDKPSASREENPNWCEAITGVFSDNDWKAMKVNIVTLESMGD